MANDGRNSTSAVRATMNTMKRMDAMRRVAGRSRYS